MHSQANFRTRTACVACLSLLLLAYASGEAHAIILQTVVERNEPAPGEGDFVGFASPAINDSGQIAFSGTVTNPGTSGVWRESLGVFDLMLGLGITPTEPSGQTVDFVDSVLLSANGDVVARVQLSSFVEGYYFANGAIVQAIAIEGEAAAGTTGSFDSIAEALRISDDGKIAFYAQLAIGGDIDINNFIGIWSGGGGTLELAAQGDGVAPSSGGATWFILQGAPGRGLPRLASDGTLAFAATTLDAPIAAPSGVWTGTPGSLAPIVFAADVQYDYAAIASSTDVAFRKAPLVSGPLAIRAGTPGSLRTVIEAGDAAPGAPGATIDLGTTLRVPSVRVNSSGQVALHALAVDGSGDREGLWSDGSGTLELLALAGDAAPGTAGLVFTEIRGFEINDLGQTAFLAEVGATIDGPGDPTLYLADVGAAPDLVAQFGADLRLGPGDVRTVSGLDVNLMETVSQGHAGGGFNQAGELVFAASFFDGTAGLYVATVPEPGAGTGAVFALGTLAALRRRCRERP
jgi:hypothetical protein